MAWSVDVHMIERERLRRGWTRAELARIAHVDPRTVCSLVVGRRRPSLGTVQALCTALGLPLTEVIMFRERQGEQSRKEVPLEGAAADDIRARRGEQRRAWARRSAHAPGRHGR